MKILSLLLFIFVSTQNASSQSSGQIPIQDGMLSYSIFGEGKPVLLLNGGPGMNSEGFRALAAKVSSMAKVQVILFDQRGTGKSRLNTLNSQTMTLDLLVQDMEVLRSHVGIDSWILFGHSFGGMLAYYYASKFPERTSAMIQSSSGGMSLDLLNNGGRITNNLSQRQRDSLTYWSQKVRENDQDENAKIRRAHYLAFGYISDVKHHSTIAERLTQGNMHINSLMWQNMRNIPFDVTSQLKTFENPVLILHGDIDIVHPNVAKEADRILPNSTLIWLPNVRHYGWLDAEELFFEKVTSFLNSMD